MTTVVRWNPLREMAAMQNTLNRLFDETWRTTGWPGANANYTLPLDVYEADNEYTIVVDMPGASQENINITLHQNVLTITVDVPQPQAREGQRVLSQERGYGKFSRSIALPRMVNSEQTQASYENGTLTLTLPVAPEAQPRRITVKTNGHSNILQSNN